MGSLQELAKKINGIGDKTKKFADIVYMFGLACFLISQACDGARVVYVHFVKFFLIIGSVVLIIATVYRLFFTFFKNWKTGLMALAVIIFGFVFTNYVPDASVFSIVTLAIVGAIGVSADYIIFTGLIANVMLIIHNVFMFNFVDSGTALYDLGGHTFFFLGANHFSFPIMNNCSSTDFASHYFFMLIAYFWFRGKKITWGEIFAAGAVDALIYSLTGSNTSFIGMGLILMFAVGVKLWDLITSKTDIIKTGEKKSVLSSVLKGFNAFVDFCFKYSFAIFAAFSIILAIAYDVGNPLLYKLNGILHLRISLGHRGIVENGIHLIAPEYPVFGARASADGYYNFLDNSYINLLVIRGVLLLLFYVICMTVVQVKHKKYFFGAALLAICALVSVEEHHLPEIQSNFFLLFLFADLGIDKKTEKIDYADKKMKKEKKQRKTFAIAGYALCAVLVFSSVLVNYPRFRLAKLYDGLDSKASTIYTSVQKSIDSKMSDGSWSKGTESISSDMYGIQLDEPEDFYDVTGSTWNDMTKDPKAHSYYAVYYDSRYSTNSNTILDYLISDEVKQLVGDGSIVVEYDVSSGKVYSVWYSEGKDCYQVTGEGSRDASRDVRLRDKMQEGYSTGDKNA